MFVFLLLSFFTPQFYYLSTCLLSAYLSVGVLCAGLSVRLSQCLLKSMNVFLSRPVSACDCIGLSDLSRPVVFFVVFVVVVVVVVVEAVVCVCVCVCV